jgi:hypothetical protein
MQFDLLENNLGSMPTSHPDFIFYNLALTLALHPRKTDVELLLAHPIVHEITGYAYEALVAGGILRHLLLRQESVFFDGDKGYEYFKKGGDIDVWFSDERTQRMWERAQESKQNPTDHKNKITRTLARISKKDVSPKNANHYEIKFPFVLNKELTLAKTTLQAVTSLFGKAVQVLQSFDIINSMVATDGKSIWIHRDAARLEKSKTLSFNPSAVASERQRNLMHRCLKYILYYGYEQFDEANDSLGTLSEWCQTRLNPESIKTCEKEDREGFLQQIEAMNQLLLISSDTLIPDHKLFNFAGISKLPKYERLTPETSGGIYRENLEYVQTAEVDSAIAVLSYREMKRAGGYVKNITNRKVDKLLSANPFGYCRYPKSSLDGLKNAITRSPTEQKSIDAAFDDL